MKDPRPLDVAAIYFPGFHRDDHYDAWFGEGWNEWDLLAKAPERFPGHRLLRPAWGSFDEADPEWMARQIDLAASHAVSVFLFDWYWYSGVQILNRPVDEALPQAPNRGKIRYALMWANHEWCNWFPAPPKGNAHLLLPMRHSPADFTRVMDHCIRHHFSQPNYWRIDGSRPFFSIYDPGQFIDQLGGPEPASQVLEHARQQVRLAGLGEVHFATFVGAASAIDKMKAAGFDSMTSYHVNSSGRPHLPNHLDDYDELVQAHQRHWESMDTGRLTYSPVLTVGWDPSPRWVADCPFPPPPEDCPNYATIVTGNTPEKFGQLCRMAKERVEASRIAPPAVFVNAWNEWTEGSALLPDEYYQCQFLDALAETFLPRPLSSSCNPTTHKARFDV